jgi:hypothetical protein
MTIITCSVDFLFERKRKIKQTYLLSWFMSIIRQFFFIKLSCLLCWLKDIHPLFHYSIFVAVLSFSLLFLNWRVLSFESTCDFHIFFSRPVAWFSCVQKRERDCVRMSAVDYLHNYICSFLGAMCSYSFYRWKKREKRVRKKDAKRHTEYLLIFYFSFSSFFFWNMLLCLQFW